MCKNSNHGFMSKLFEAVDNICEVSSTHGIGEIIKNGAIVVFESDDGVTSNASYKITWQWGDYVPEEQDDRSYKKRMYQELMRNPEYRNIAYKASLTHDEMCFMDNLETQWKEQNSNEPDAEVRFGRATHTWSGYPGYTNVRERGTSVGYDSQGRYPDDSAILSEAEIEPFIESLRNSLCEQCGVTPDAVNTTHSNERINSSCGDDTTILYCKHPPMKNSEYYGGKDEITMCAYTIAKV